MLNDHLWNRVWLFCPSQKTVPPHLLDEQPNTEGARAAWRPVICSFLPPHPTPHTLSVATGSRSLRAHASATSQDAPVFLSQWLAEAQLPQRCPGSPTREPLLARPPATATTRKQAGFLGPNTDQHHPAAPVFCDPHSPGTYHTL